MFLGSTQDTHDDLAHAMSRDQETRDHEEDVDTDVVTREPMDTHERHRDRAQRLDLNPEAVLPEEFCPET